MKMSPLGWVAFVLTIIGGLNWGLVGVSGIDLVAVIFGDLSVVSRIVYILVGLAAIYMLVKAFTKEKTAENPAPVVPQM